MHKRQKSAAGAIFLDILGGGGGEIAGKIASEIAGEVTSDRMCTNVKKAPQARFFLIYIG